MPRGSFVEVDPELLKREYEAGLSINAIAKKYHYSIPTLWRRFKAFGIELDPARQFGGRKGTGKYPQLRDREWLADQLRVKTTKDIAREIGSTPGNVSDFVKRYGLREGDRSEAVKAGIAKHAHEREPRNGEQSPHWNGGRYTTEGGYTKVYHPDHPSADGRGYVLEHRAVMEEHLGRSLKDDEVVHHVNYNKTDNRIENLELLPNQEAHAQLHNTVRSFVRKIKRLNARIAELEEENQRLIERLRQA